MFGPIGGYELLLILVLALLLFGPRRMPQIGRQIARALGELRAAAGEFRGELEREVDMEDLRRTREELREATDEIGDSVRSVARERPTGDAAPPEPPADDDGSPPER